MFCTSLETSLCNYSGLVAPRVSLVQIWCHLTWFALCRLVAFLVDLLHTVHLVGRLQYQFIWYWYDLVDRRIRELLAPERTHSPPGHVLALEILEKTI